MGNPAIEPVIFLTLVRAERDVAGARTLIASLRAFGGALAQNPFWVFNACPAETVYRDLEAFGARVIPLNTPAPIRDYAFGDKVFACAQAEALATPARTLVWIDPTCVVVNPPTLFDLGDAWSIAVRPVHIRNIGLRATDPLDLFWREIYAAVGIADVAATVESFVDRQTLRAYFNSHAFAFDSAIGLAREWLARFTHLVGDSGFQAHACADELHPIFLHQAVYSALIAARVPVARVRRLPPTYNYPYNLHATIPADCRARALNDLVCFTYEERALDPARLTDIRVDEPLRTWLAAH